MEAESSAACDSARLYRSVRELMKPQAMLGEEDDGYRMSIDSWVQCYEEEVVNFPSVALFCEMKLREVFSQPVEKEPDAFRTAVVCDLHSKLVGLFGRYGSLMGALHTEMCKAIYPVPPDASDEERAAPWLSYKTPFFGATQELEAQNKQNERELYCYKNKDDFLEQECARRQFAVTFTVNCWRRKGFWSSFVRWKLQTQHGVKFRKTVDSIMGRGKGGVFKDCFKALKDWYWRRKVIGLNMFLQHQTGKDVAAIQADMKKTIAREGLLGEGEEAEVELMKQLSHARERVQQQSKATEQLAKAIFQMKDAIELEDVKKSTKIAGLLNSWMTLATDLHLETYVGEAPIVELKSMTDAAQSSAEGFSAAKIQASFRGRKTRAKAVELKEQKVAATRLQAMVRGKRQRASFHDVRKSTRLGAAAAAPGTADGGEGPRQSAKVLRTMLDALKFDIQDFAEMPEAPHTDLFAECTVGSEAELLGVLTAWVDHHLAAAGLERRLTDWSSDLVDCEVFACLLDRIAVQPQEDCAPLLARIRLADKHAVRASMLCRHINSLNRKGIFKLGFTLRPDQLVAGGAGAVVPYMQYAVARLLVARPGLPAPSTDEEIEALEERLAALEEQLSKARADAAVLGGLAEDVVAVLARVQSRAVELQARHDRWHEVSRAVRRFATSKVSEFQAVPPGE